jgi:hypothetical protein
MKEPRLAQLVAIAGRKQRAALFDGPVNRGQNLNSSRHVLHIAAKVRDNLAHRKHEPSTYTVVRYDRLYTRLYRLAQLSQALEGMLPPNNQLNPGGHATRTSAYQYKTRSVYDTPGGGHLNHKQKPCKNSRPSPPLLVPCQELHVSNNRTIYCEQQVDLQCGAHALHALLCRRVAPHPHYHLFNHLQATNAIPTNRPRGTRG